MLCLAIRSGTATKAVVEKQEHQFGSGAALAAAANAKYNSSCLRSLRVIGYPVWELYVVKYGNE